tara:strand:+ start:986 stop:1441 length:456 start_codon:yes stop_codon:yes gene_type:complete
MNRRRAFLLGCGAFLLSGGLAQAEPVVMSAPEAFEQAANGQILLLDIRSPAEWAEDGVAQGALTVTMHSAAFAGQLQALMARNPGKPLAMICATGGRTRYVATVLAQNGINGVVDVSEGMHGNGTDPGWLARGLPLVDALTAQQRTRSALD